MYPFSVIMIKTLTAIALSAFVGCSTPQKVPSTPAPFVGDPYGVVVNANQASSHIGSYMLVENNGLPYARMTLKCGECPREEGFLSVYKNLAWAQDAKQFLQSKFQEDYWVEFITPDTIEERITSRLTSGRKR